MSDIVERLRAWAMDARLGKKLLGADQDLDEAATAIEARDAEIERLREDLARTERNRDMWKGQVERQSAEIARLREALEEIEGCQSHNPDNLFRIARAALKVSP